MVINGRGVGVVLVCGALVGCVSSGRRPPPRLPHETPEATAESEHHDGSCAWSSAANAPAFDVGVAEGAIQHAMERAARCGLHTRSHFDLSLTLSWGGSGCVAHVELESEVPNDVGECLVRRFSDATTKPFSGSSPEVQVRMTNDRFWWTWL
jgi:hypothetical protein